MKTDLNPESSNLFRKSRVVIRPIEDTELEKSANQDYTDIDELIGRVTAAIKSKNEDELRWLQLEVQLHTMIFLKMIDWKMWEIHKKFVK